MIKKIKTKYFDITLVLRHRWEKTLRVKYIHFREYQIRLWYRKDKCVAEKGFKKPTTWHKNLIDQHVIGVEILVFRAWVTINRKGIMEIPLRD